MRLEKDGRTLVIDPGGFSEEDAAVGADAILVTHEHPDHFDEGRLRAGLEADPAAEMWTLKSVTDKVAAAFPGRVHTVGHGDTFTAAGFDVQVHGELHAEIHPDIPSVTNVGFLVDGGLSSIPATRSPSPSGRGDADAPVMAPWSQVAEVIDYVRELRPRARLRHPRRPPHRAGPAVYAPVASLAGAEHCGSPRGDRGTLTVGPADRWSACASPPGT